MFNSSSIVALAGNEKVLLLCRYSRHVSPKLEQMFISENKVELLPSAGIEAVPCYVHGGLQKRYSVIYADPAWSYKFKDPTASKGGAKGSGYSAVELFARNNHEGWDVMGFDVDGKSIQESIKLIAQ